MPLWKIAWRSIQQRGLASALTTFSMALGVMLVVAVLLVHGVVQESFRTNASLGYNMIVGPKGGKLQLVLNTVYYLSEPVETLPYDFYLDFVTAEEVQKYHSEQEQQAIRDRRNEELTKGRMEFFAARWWGERLDEDEAFELASHWWREKGADARREAAMKGWEKLPDDVKGKLPKEAFVEYVSGDLSSPPSDLARAEFLELARPQLRERFVDLAIAWRIEQRPASGEGVPALTDEQWETLEKFQLAEHFGKLLDYDLLDGPYSRQTDEVTPNLAIPVLLGDYYKQYRVVGTSTKMFDELEYIPEENKKYAFAQGRNFKYWDEKNGFFEAVVGHTVAKEYNLQLGDKLVASHGAAESDESQMHTESAFTVVGILRPSGTPNDRAVFVNMEGFFLMEGHARKEDEADKTVDDAVVTEASAVESDEAASGDEQVGAESTESEVEDRAADADAKKSPRKKPLPLEEREVSAVLFRCKDPFASMAHTNFINEGEIGQVVLPVAEIFSLFDFIVTPIQTLLLIVTAMICVVSGMSILVSIYNSMNERKHEIAVMRALGAGRSTVMSIVLLESIMISLVGGMLGWVAGHLLIGAAGGVIEERTGVTVGVLDFAPPIPLDHYQFTRAMFITCVIQAALALLAGVTIFVMKVTGWSNQLSKGSFAGFIRGLMATLPAVLFVCGALGVISGNLAYTGPPSIEFLILPPLLLLAIIVGFLPALTAYRTDVAKSLQ